MGSFDVVTYALCKHSATGISKIEVNKDGDLVFTMADGSKIVVDMPIKLDCLDLEIVTTLPTTGIEENKIYLLRTAMTDTSGSPIYLQYLWKNNAWVIMGTSGEPIATGNQYGMVKLDNKSIVTNTSGEIEVDGDYLNDHLIQNIPNSSINDLFD